MKTDQASSGETTQNDDLAARLLALNLLATVLDRKTPLDQVLDSSSAFAALPQRDRSFCRMLLTTTLRRLGQIDDLIVFAQEKPDSLKTPQVLHILRLGVTQIFFMDVADHAAVDTAVRMTEHIKAIKQKGFVNAILRELLRHGKARLDHQDAGRLNTPDWLLKALIADYGLNTAARIVNANLEEAPLDITLKASENPSYWAGALNARVLPTGSLRRASSGNIRDLEGFDTGQWWIQDAAAALPAKLFGNIKNRHVIDLCAAPGGKTLQLASMGAQVTALDRSAKRLKRLEENLDRMALHERVQIVVSDAAEWNPPEAPSMILLDAPCSATGTIRRHPDTGYLKSPRDIERLMIVQSRMLAHAANILSPGGILVYCTCSLLKAESESQIETLLRVRSDLHRHPVHSDETGGIPEIIDGNGDLRILPIHLADEGGMDGFYASRLIKT